MTRAQLRQLVWRWRRTLLARDLNFAVATFFAAWALTCRWPDQLLWLPPAASIAVLIARFLVVRPWKVPEHHLLRHIDRTYPQLEESSFLWLRAPGELRPPERLQLRRINLAAARLASPAFGRPPAHFLRASRFCLAAGAVLWIAVAVGPWPSIPRRPVPSSASTLAPSPALLPLPPPGSPPLHLKSARLIITPPAYTGRPSRTVDNLDADIEEGSAVTWRIAFNQPITEAHMDFGESGVGTARFHPGPEGSQEITRVITDTTLYVLAAALPDGSVRSLPELHALKVIRDQPPVVKILQPSLPRTTIGPAALPSPVLIEVLASDDYALTDTHLVVTVAKGSGEAVRFREQSLPFDLPAAPGTNRHTKLLDLATLDMAPGDELYYFAEARDNYQPHPHAARSETRFIIWQGEATATAAAAPGRGLTGVDLIPPYFRSQRQLIIDTEKLIADRPALADPEFRTRANDLGADQSLLRLRYGQFLGEEAEHAPGSDHHDEDNEDAASPYPDRPAAAEQIRRPFVDSHDTLDKTTFFDDATQGTMRDALAAMWQAEGFLRSARPQDALLPERRALEILKQLQQDARSYVQRVGFEPAPLKVDERRLRDDPGALPPHLLAASGSGLADPQEVHLRAALAARPWRDAAQLDALRRAEPALTAAASRRPEDFLESLRAFRRLVLSGEAVPAADLPRIERALLRLLPPASALPARAPESDPSLANSYFQAAP